MKKISIALFCVATVCLNLQAQSAFINEVNYLANHPTEGVEIAGQAGQDLTGWSLEGYGLDGALAFTETIQNIIIPDKQNGSGSIWMEVAQSNSGGALALVDNNGQVVQFLSYGLAGTANAIITATEGSAAGMVSDFIGIQLLPGNSLELTGTGSQYQDFIWGLPLGSTPGEVNTWQLFTAITRSLRTAGSGPQAENSITLYPNPAVELAQLRLKAPAENPVKASIFNASGQLVAEYMVTAGSNTLEIEAAEWPSGMYFLRMQGKTNEPALAFMKR